MRGSVRPIVTAVVILAVFGGLVGLAFVARQQTSDLIVLKLAHGLDTTHPVHKGMEHLAKRLAERSQGRVVVQIFPNEQLGSERAMIEQLQLGCIDMTKSSTAVLEQFVPEIGVFSLPYVFRDDDHFWSVLDGPLGAELLAASRRVGLRGVCYFDAGSRSFYTVNRPIEHPDDLAGMRIRVQQSRTAMELIRTLGGSPTPIDWGELYTALQQGQVEGAENNPPSLLTSRHYEVARYYALNEHTQVPDILLISEVVWQKLPAEVQQWLAESAEEASHYQRQLWREQTELALQQLCEAGVTVSHPDKTPFFERVTSMHEGYAGTAIGDLLQRIRAQ